MKISVESFQPEPIECKAFQVSLTSLMSSHKATSTITQNKLKIIDQYRMQKSSEEYGLMIIVQEKNFSYGVNAHKGMKHGSYYLQ